MNDLLNGDFSAPVNGSAINGRGVKHLKLSREELIALAADVASGVRPIDLSLRQAADMFGVSPAAVSAELKARAATDGNGYALNIEKRFVETWHLLSDAQRRKVFREIPSSGFKYGRATGAIEAVLACCQVPMTIIKPSAWKKFHHLHGGDKEGGRQRAVQLFPSAHALLARKKDHGRAPKRR